MRERLRIRGGDAVEFCITDEGALLLKAPAVDSLERAHGSLKLGKTTAQVMRELRGEFVTD